MRQGNSLTPKQVAKLISLKAMGLPNAFLAERFSVSQQCIRDTLSRDRGPLQSDSCISGNALEAVRSLKGSPI